MRVLLFSQMFEPEPGGRGLALGRWLRARGHEVEVLTGFPSEPFGKVYPGYRQSLLMRECLGAVPVLRVPHYTSHDTSALRRMAMYGSFALSASVLGMPRVRAADVVYVLHPPTIGPTAIANKVLRGTPFVYNIPDLWPESVLESGMVAEGRGRRVLRRTIEKVLAAVYRHAASITVISQGLKDVLVERGVPAEKVHVIYNWVEEDVFGPVPRDERLARELGFDGRTHILYAGNFGALQGLDAVVRAAAVLRDRRDVRVAFMGAGQFEAQLRAQVDRLSLSNVAFLPTRPFKDMPSIYALADAILVPLRRAPMIERTALPSKTQVALACGRPLLVATRGDAAALARRSGAGLTCEPEDAAQIATAMVRFADMPREEREQMGAKGRAFYVRELSCDVGARHAERVLAAAAGKGHRGLAGR